MTEVWHTKNWWPKNLTQQIEKNINDIHLSPRLRPRPPRFGISLLNTTCAATFSSVSELTRVRRRPTVVQQQIKKQFEKEKNHDNDKNMHKNIFLIPPARLANLTPWKAWILAILLVMYLSTFTAHAHCTDAHKHSHLENKHLNCEPEMLSL